MGLEKLAGNAPVIGVMGPKFSGKSIIAAALADQGFTRFAFAGKLKEAAMSIYGLSHEQVYGNLKEEVDPRYGIAPRFIMQQFGTEVCRSIHVDTWVLALERHIDAWCQGKLYSDVAIIVDDLRYPNEAEYIRRWGGVIWEVHRPGYEYTKEHSSEEHPLIEADRFLWNGATPADLCQLTLENWEGEKRRWQTPTSNLRW